MKDAKILGESLAQQFPRRGSGGSKAKAKGGFLGNSTPEKMSNAGGLMRGIFDRTSGQDSPMMPTYNPMFGQNQQPQQPQELSGLWKNFGQSDPFANLRERMGGNTGFAGGMFGPNPKPTGGNMGGGFKFPFMGF